jgi:hypothetical protein
MRLLVDRTAIIRWMIARPAVNMTWAHLGLGPPFRGECCARFIWRDRDTDA